jgi:hypothetical protein
LLENLKIIAVILFLGIFLQSVNSQIITTHEKLFAKIKPAENILGLNEYMDSTKKETTVRKIKLSGLFLSVGGGLSVPTHEFIDNSLPSFGLLARVEFSSTAIFPFVIGGEIDYFSYTGQDQFKTLNQLNNYQTKIFSAGLTVEYALSRFFNSAYTIPFLALDVKTNKISRVYDAGVTLSNYPGKESRVSIGAGFGFTLFVMDFVIKYNFEKELSNLGVYTKIKFPVIRF